MAGDDPSAQSWTALTLNPPVSNQPGVFPRKLIEPHESVLFETRPGLWGKYWPGLVFFGFFFVTVLGGSVLDGQLLSGIAIVVVLFGIPIALIVLAWMRTAYALTDRRVLSVSGLFSRSFQMAGYDEVQNLTAGSGSSGTIVFDTNTTRRGLLARGSRMSQRIVWSKVPYCGQVYEFIQHAFGVRSAEAQKENVRKALLAHAMQNTIPCAYCGGAIDIRSVNLSNANCPRCGAPLLPS